MSIMFKADLHIHTIYSLDSVIEPSLLIKVSKKIGLKAIAITEHDTIEGAVKILRDYRDPDLIIIPGVEFTLWEGHLIGLNIMKMPSKRLSLPELIEFIHGEGGIAVIAHPFDIIRGFKKIEENIKHVDAVEVANASDLRLKKNMDKAMKLCEEHDRGYTAGSDAHVIEALGQTYLYCEEELENIDDIIEYVLKKRFKIHAGKTPLHSRLKKYLKRF